MPVNSGTSVLRGKNGANQSIFFDIPEHTHKSVLNCHQDQRRKKREPEMKIWPTKIVHVVLFFSSNILSDFIPHTLVRTKIPSKRLPGVLRTVFLIKYVANSLSDHHPFKKINLSWSPQKGVAYKNPNDSNCSNFSMNCE